MSGGCDICGEVGKALKCGRCSSRKYCGVDCQKQDWPSHKANCQRPNFILKIDLHPRHIVSPRITRTISCPATATFADFHHALIVGFGWANTHLYDFDVLNTNQTAGRENYFSSQPCLFKITDLSTIDDYDDQDTRDSSKTILFKVLDNPETQGKIIIWNYDFGDGWEHVISCIGRADPTSNFVCLGGEGHGCAEDVGGFSGWQELLDAYDAVKPSKEQKENMKWFETSASNKDPEGLRGAERWRWDKYAINAVLAELGTASSVRATPGDTILLISLEKQLFFDSMYSEHLQKLRAKATVIEVTHIASAMRHLTKAKPEKTYAAIIVTDAAMIEDDSFVAVANKLEDYVGRGGTAIFGFSISSFCNLSKLNTFFKKTWLKDWEYGSYGRSTFELNPQSNSRFTNPQNFSLQPFYMKALYLKNTKIEEMVCLDTDDLNQSQSPIVFGQYKRGYLGWIGDVNIELAVGDILLAMCRL